MSIRRADALAVALALSCIPELKLAILAITSEAVAPSLIILLMEVSASTESDPAADSCIDPMSIRRADAWSEAVADSCIAELKAANAVIVLTVLADSFTKADVAGLALVESNAEADSPALDV